MEIGVRELKENLSLVLQRASEGEKITITSHGHPLCTISPLEEHEIEHPAFIQLGSAQGWLTPASALVRSVVKPIKPKKTGKSTSQLLRESRAERF